jgi:hypothetical protein
MTVLRDNNEYVLAALEAGSIQFKFWLVFTDKKKSSSTILFSTGVFQVKIILRQFLTSYRATNTLSTGAQKTGYRGY